MRYGFHVTEFHKTQKLFNTKELLAEKDQLYNLHCAWPCQQIIIIIFCIIIIIIYSHIRIICVNETTMKRKFV